MLEGQPVDGFCAATTRTIWLDGAVTDDVIAGVLRHEHTHAWEMEVGTPRTHEDLANFAATVGDAFDAEFAAQGGAAALAAIPVEGLRPPGSATPPTARGAVDRVCCGRCAAEIMSGSIHSDAPRPHETTGIFLVDRGFQCPVCDAVQLWEERAAADGLPLGNYFNVRLLTGQAAAEWASTHRVHSPYNFA